MKAMILAAGLGTRLKPFTSAHPKALYVVNGKTLLEHAIDHLKSAGIEDVIINVHHFAGQITDFVNQHDHFGLRITISDETGELLETGGGVKKAAWFFQNCNAAIIRNVDIISDLDLTKVLAAHHDSGSLATLAVRQRETSRYLLFDEDLQLCGWENRKTGERLVTRESVSHLSHPGDDTKVQVAEALTPYGFSGIQVVSPEMFPLITEEGKFTLTNLYLRLAQTQKITGYLESAGIWEDVGQIKK